MTKKLLELAENLRSAGKLPECGIPEAVFGEGSRGEADVNDHNDTVEEEANILISEIKNQQVEIQMLSSALEVAKLEIEELRKNIKIRL